MHLLLSLLACRPATVGVSPEDSGAPALGGALITDTETERVEGPPALDLFSDALIHELALDVDSSSISSLRYDPYDYTDATLTLGGRVMEVGIRIKGSSTGDDIYGKPSLKVMFDYAHEGQRYEGMRKVNLHNQTLDPILSSEWLTYGYFREAGLPAARVGYARLTLNDEDYGLYTIVEDPEDDFLGRWFTSDDGNLYENAANYCDLTRVSCFDREESDEGNDDALERLIDAAGLSGQAWREAMQAQMDWARFVGFFAMERSIAHWDSYSFDQSNYRLYHDPEEDTWAFIPWSADLGFGYRPWSYPDCGRHGVNPADYDMGMLAASCERDAVCIDAVLDQMLEYADLVESMDPGPRVDAALDRVRSEAATDPDHYNEMDHFEEHGECVRAFLVDRPSFIRQWVASQR